jgi:hypothetical protein
MITIEVDKKGIKRVFAVEGSVAESQENSDVLRATALPRQLLHNAVVEAFNGLDDTTTELDEPAVWIPTERDGELDLPRKVIVKVNMLPRDALECVPSWFVAGCKKVFPKEDWAEAEAPLPKGDLLSIHNLEPVKDEEPTIGEVPADCAYFEQHRDLTEEELNKIHGAPYCSRIEEQAVMLFHERVNGFVEFGGEKLLDHWGWCGECDDNDTLIAEPYAVDHEGLTKLSAMCDQIGWTYKIKGISGHYPGSTVRIEIRPKGQSK